MGWFSDNEDKMMQKAKDAVRAEVLGKIELERREKKKKKRKKFFKFLGGLIVVSFWVSVGYMIGVHRNVIKEFFETGKCPKLPKNHPCPFIK